MGGAVMEPVEFSIDELHNLAAEVGDEQRHDGGSVVGTQQRHRCVAVNEPPKREGLRECAHLVVPGMGNILPNAGDTESALVWGEECAGRSLVRHDELIAGAARGDIEERACLREHLGEFGGRDVLQCCRRREASL